MVLNSVVLWAVMSVASRVSILVVWLAAGRAVAMVVAMVDERVARREVHLDSQRGAR